MKHRFVLGLISLSLAITQAARADDLIPPLSQIKPDHPRLLVRPGETKLAISLAQLRAAPHDGDFNAMLAQLKKQDNAAAQAMVWLLTQDAAAADKAVTRMRAYRYPGNVDTFHSYFHLTELGLAYDWLYNYPGFTKEIRAEIRVHVAPLAREALRVANDHMFHNYVWMSAGGMAMWGLATAGEDQASDQLCEQMRQRFNRGLFPAWKYMDGLPSEPMGYWSLYVLTPGVFTVLAAQSAFEADLVSAIRTNENGWLDRHFENLIHSTLPDMRYVPWGDLQSGPNGGVSMEMAGMIDAATWALQSATGRYFGQWLAGKRGLSRFYGDTAIYYMLYTRQLAGVPAKTPPLSYLAGNKQSGHFIARGGWDDDATIATFTCTDHFGDHHHYDQGSFIIYRRGLLAVDPPVYRQVRGPQQKTENHNTLLIGGQPQRPARGQWFTTVEDFQKNLTGGRKLETGNILFHHDEPGWAAVAGQFVQAYDCPELSSVVRQLLFIRPGTVIIVDRLVANAGKQCPPVQWLLQLPAEPKVEDGAVTVSTGKSLAALPSYFAGGAKPTIEPTPVNTQRLSLAYPGGNVVTLVHVMEVGDGTAAGPAASVKAAPSGRGIEVSIGERAFVFGIDTRAEVTEQQLGSR